MMVTGMGSMTSTSGVNRMMRISFITWITRIVKTRAATCRVPGMTMMAGITMMTGMIGITRMTWVTRMTWMSSITMMTRVSRMTTMTRMTKMTRVYTRIGLR